MRKCDNEKNISIMKKYLLSGMIVALTASFIMSCGGKNQTQENENLQDSTDVAPAEKPTLYGIAASTTQGDTLKLMIDNGDTLTIDVTAARENQKLFGELTGGDRMIVLTNVEKTVAEVVINQNMLLGDWVMPDPIDGSSEIGIKIKEGGIAEGIEQSTISYRTWKVVDGQLEIVSIRDGGGQEEETNYYDIIKLTQDSLTYKNDEDTFEYSRQKPREQYGNDVDLESSSLEDFIM